MSRESQEAGTRSDAYIVTPQGTYPVRGGSWLDVEDEGVVVIRSGRQGAPLAAVAVTDETWVFVGEAPPERLPEREAGEAGAGGWPPEPPPDVDGPVAAGG